MYVKVVMPNVDQIFTYAVPEELGAAIKVGQRVAAPFGKGNKTLEGIVLEIDVDKDGEFRAKEIVKILDKEPIINGELLRLALWMKDYYYCTYHQALSCVIPSNIKKEKVVKWVRLLKKDVKPAEYAANQGKALTSLLQISEQKLADLVGENKSLRSAVGALDKKGIVEIYEEKEHRKTYDLRKIKRTKALELTEEQRAVLGELVMASSSKKWRTQFAPTDECECFEERTVRPYDADGRFFLLRGVTGSGKTEVYLQFIEYLMKNGKDAIVLVPEISLTPQTVERFVGRFGDKVSVLHSGLSAGEKFDEWQRILRGEVKVAIGARSAVFAPFANLGAIIIDEEQEGAYKSDSAPKYDAHEVAKWRCGENGAILLLASATPSVKSFHSNEYKLLEMNKRHNEARLPKVEIVDMRRELADGNKSMFSNLLQNEIRKNLENGEQTILFLNRRGFHSFMSCRSCGEAIKCKNCNVTLTYHKTINRLVCHHCDYSEPPYTECPYCGSPYVRYFGDGTQKIDEEIRTLFPEATSIRMDYDTTATKNAHAEILREFCEKKIDILVGTQMVTKGLDFENVTLVGVVMADLSLNMDDFRAYERTFSQLTQVCGRAGRGDKEGRAVIQTYQPDHYVINLAKEHDYLRFYEREIKMRENFNNPPFCDMVMLMAVGSDREVLKNSLNRAVKMLGGGFLSTAPSPAPISKIKGLYRWRVLIKCDADMDFRLRLRAVIEHFRGEQKFSLSADVNPNSLF